MQDLSMILWGCVLASCMGLRGSELYSAQCKALEPHFGDAPWLGMWLLEDQSPTQPSESPQIQPSGESLRQLYRFWKAEPCPDEAPQGETSVWKELCQEILCHQG